MYIKRDSIEIGMHAYICTSKEIHFNFKIEIIIKIKLQRRKRP